MLAFTLQMAAPPSAISINHKQILSAVDVFNLRNLTSQSFHRNTIEVVRVYIDDVFYYLLDYLSFNLSKQKYIPQQWGLIDVILIHILSLLQIINI